MTSNPAAVQPLPTASLLEDTLQRLRLREADIVARDDRAWAAWRRWEHGQRGRVPATLGAVQASFVALAVLDDPADLDRAVALADQLGVERVAQLQHRASRVVDADPGLPRTTRVVHRLLGADASARLGRALLFADVALDAAAPTDLTSVRSALVALSHGGSVVEGREALGMLATEPWGPLADELTDQAAAADRDAIATLLAWCREWRADQDRRVVGRQIQRLIALSGVTQRQFAARIGTSPSRLSSYVTGAVTPSATLLLRMQRSARAFQIELAAASAARA